MSEKEAPAETSEQSREESPLSSLRDRVETGADGKETAIESDDPFDALAEEEDQAAGRAEELFDQEGVEALDADVLWDQLEGGPTATGGQSHSEREIRTISKRSYCHQCEFFKAPPAVGCTNEGTDILELIGLDEFRVADCPVVLEDERLER